MHSPHVVEIPRHLDPVSSDTFIAGDNRDVHPAVYEEGLKMGEGQPPLTVLKAASEAIEQWDHDPEVPADDHNKVLTHA